MSLSTPKPQLTKHQKLTNHQMTADRSINQSVQLSEPLRRLNLRRLNPNAVISNDWVPATQFSKMHTAEPVQVAGPLRPRWYFALVKNLLAKVIFFVRSTA